MVGTPCQLAVANSQPILMQRCRHAIIATIATLCGRFYAMDRDERWDRVEKAFNLIVSGTGKIADDVNSAIGASYERG